MLIFWRTVQYAPNFLDWNSHIFLFWLNPTGHSKFHNASNIRSDCLYSHTRQCRRSPLTPSPLLPPPYSLPPFFPVPDRGTGEDQYLCPCQACATTTCIVKNISFSPHRSHQHALIGNLADNQNAMLKQMN